MKRIITGIFLVLTLNIFAVVFNAQAGTQADLIKLITGKTIIYDGTCMLNKKGLFPKPKEATTEQSCVVGVDEKEVDIYYVLVRDRSGKPLTLIVINMDGGTQKVVWYAGVEA